SAPQRTIQQQPTPPAPRAVRPAEAVEQAIAAYILDAAGRPITSGERKEIKDAEERHLKLVQAQRAVFMNPHPTATNKNFVDDLLAGKNPPPLHMSDLERESRKWALSEAMATNNREFGVNTANGIRQRLIDAAAKWIAARQADEKSELDKIGIEHIDSPLLVTVKTHLQNWKYRQISAEQRQSYSAPASQLTFIKL
ncbi:MAG: hypothetical protein ABSF34_18145, partial [Verrucomicrobiota bacterium]